MIEVLLVVAILGVIAAAVVPASTSVRARPMAGFAPVRRRLKHPMCGSIRSRNKPAARRRARNRVRMDVKSARKPRLKALPPKR